MKKLILCLGTVMFGALSLNAQTPYDNFAPEQSVKSMIELPQMQFRVENTDSNSEVSHVEFDKNTLSLNLFDENDNVIKTLVFDPNEKKFLTMDPLAEKYYNISPYVFCMNNPIRFIDPDGRDVWEINDEGRIINRIEDPTQDAFYMVAKDANGNYQRTFTTDAEGNKNYNSISFEYGTVELQRTISINSTDSYDVYKVRGDANGTNFFEFVSNNVTGSGTAVEVSQSMTGIAGDKGLNFITTSHMKATEPGVTHLLNGQLLHGYTIRELNHSHPYSPNPSNSDTGFSSQVSNIMTKRNVPAPAFNIYYVPNKQKIPFGK